MVIKVYLESNEFYNYCSVRIGLQIWTFSVNDLDDCGMKAIDRVMAWTNCCYDDIEVVKTKEELRGE